MAAFHGPKNAFKHFISAKFKNMSFVLVSFWSISHISRVYLPLVDNKSLSSLVRELMSILNCIIFGLQGKSFKSFSNEFFV